MNKEQKIDIINRAIDLDQGFGNKIVDMADIWRDTINSELKRYNKHKIKALIIEANDIIKQYGEVPVYARDLKENLLVDAFMGKGFEEALKKAKENDRDLIVGKFVKNGKWRME